MRRLVIALAILASAGPAAGSDLPWGGDTLPYLLGKADLVVRGPVTGSTRLAKRDAGPGHRVHEVQERAVLKGASAAKRRLTFVAPDSFPVTSPRRDAIVFLKQLEAPTAAVLGVAGAPAYVAVSGGHGVIDAGSGRAAAVDALLAAGQDPRRLEAWARQTAGSADPLLQRSAVQLLYDHADEPWSVPLLAEVVRAAGASLETREFAVQALADSAHPAAAQTLLALRAEPLPDNLRRAVVEGLATTGGETP